MEATPIRQVFHAYDMAGSARDTGLRFCPRCGARCVRDHAGGRLRSRCPHCGYIHYRNPAPGVAVVLMEDGCVLLGRRAAGARWAGRWGLPAGFIEFDEDFLTAARREAKEETGLEIEVTGILNVTFNYLAASLHALVVAVAARPVGGALAAGDDLCELRWLPLEGPFPPLAYEADAELLQRLAGDGVRHLPVDARYAGACPG
jgi:8-oxo-dGTP diphosphatase